MYLCGPERMNHAQTIALYQPMLHTIAYNLVRCKEDAEDIVQETFAKWLSVDHQKIQNTKAYLIRAVTNNCLNHLESFRKKKEEYLDTASEAFQRFKENNFAHLDFDAAIHVLQAKLEPLERAVFVLKEVFDFDYDDIQQALDKKKEHCRQLVFRAKQKLAEETSRITLPDTTRWIDSFKKACHLGNVSELVQDLKKDISAFAEKKF
jgi:RNA polymerase sigma factor (sigma-70 family)